ncbi:hypothetical protein VPHD480_0200 [Vibrio phage D480]
MKIDSIAKIIKDLGMICKTPFTYNGNVYLPKTMKLRGEVRQGFTCPAMCGSCCGNWSLDYIPEKYLKHDSLESLPPLALVYGQNFIKRTVNVNGKEIEFITDPQGDDVPQQTNKPDGCRYLNKEGRCDIHNFVLSGRYGQPFSCDFEIIRFISPQGEPDGYIENAESVSEYNVNPSNRMGRVNTEYYRYARRMKDINGEHRDDKPFDHPDYDGMSVQEIPGPKCRITPIDQDSIDDAVRKFSRLLEWADYLGIETWIPEMIEWIKNGSSDSLIVNAKRSSNHESIAAIPFDVEYNDGKLVKSSQMIGLSQFL